MKHRISRGGDGRYVRGRSGSVALERMTRGVPVVTMGRVGEEKQVSVPGTSVSNQVTRRGGTLIAAAAGFLVLFVLVGVVTPAVASSALPLPGDPVAKARDWFAHNQVAAVTTGVLQVLSVGCLAAFAARFAGVVPAARRARPWAFAAAGLMVLSSVLGWILAAIAPSASMDTVEVLRTANFIAGGTAHVVVLGVFVLLAARAPGFGRPVRIFGYVAAAVSVLSLVSLVWYTGSVLIVLGRLLCMVWVICAAVSTTRQLARG